MNEEELPLLPPRLYRQNAYSIENDELILNLRFLIYIIDRTYKTCQTLIIKIIKIINPFHHRN